MKLIRNLLTSVKTKQESIIIVFYLIYFAVLQLADYTAIILHIFYSLKAMRPPCSNRQRPIQWPRAHRHKQRL